MPLIVPHDLAYLAAQGDVTAIRRPVVRRRKTKWAHRCPYGVGKIYTLGTLIYEEDGTRRYRTVGRIEIEDVRRETLADLTDEAAKAEGYETVEDALEVWREKHGSDRRSRECWVISWRMVERRLLAQQSQYGYTDKPENALGEAGEAPPVDWMDRETKDRAEVFEISRSISRLTAFKMREYERLNNAERMGRTAQVRSIKRKIEWADRELRDAA